MGFEPGKGLHENSPGAVSPDTTRLKYNLETRGFQRLKLHEIYNFSVYNTYIYVLNGNSYSANSFNDLGIRHSAITTIKKCLEPCWLARNNEKSPLARTAPIQTETALSYPQFVQFEDESVHN